MLEMLEDVVKVDYSNGTLLGEACRPGQCRLQEATIQDDAEGFCSNVSAIVLNEADADSHRGFVCAHFPKWLGRRSR